MAGIPKLEKTDSGEDMHFSVGAIIKRDGKYLLMDRMKPPYGFAGIAGHIDEGEQPQEALIREVKEESNLNVLTYKKLIEEIDSGEPCSKGVGIHYWYLFECETTGEPKAKPDEVKSLGWYSKEEIKNLNLETVWKKWLKRLGII
ncbi:NUDIX domain-containing protein [Candidatus Woesearchaeota archaeon]|jgi:ADP-ribose pyrophosphatase YjhB (NUDIX family)|nr:NUDIX domain-containing protein [Candidatus Woesearchaeota archaeon]MBT6519990.1 NUDIX domain-containing protein [Candidatus Woesearchaeota archaeon]MBT7367809.1 NUDIX domain-containing protein [Candidatus Woesearchaeota archaeon]